MSANRARWTLFSISAYTNLTAKAGGIAGMVDVWFKADTARTVDQDLVRSITSIVQGFE